MSISDSMGLLLTSSQEFDLLTDHDVGSIMTLFDDNLIGIKEEQQQTNQQQQPQLRYEDLYEHQLATQPQKEYHNNQNRIITYVPVESPLPSLIPHSLPVVNNSVIRNEEYAGPYNFEVFIDPHHGSKNPWVYSTVLNKLFITVSNPFPVDFKWENKQAGNFFVRAMPLFSLAQHAQDLVVRCIPHRMPGDTTNGNIPEHIWDHVIRCQSLSADYHGNKDNNMHLNVVAPLGTPQTGTDCVRLMYSFVCKNSCPTGMNRKPFEVVFTLEDEMATIHGRRKLNVRVCSCPKRDKEKEEKDFLKEGPPPQQAKKRKLDKNGAKPPVPSDQPLDTTEYVVVVKVCGKHNQRNMIKHGLDLMGGELLRHGPNAAIQKCANTIAEQLKNLG